MTMKINSGYLKLPGKNIIIVEDDFPSVKYYRTLLHSTGATITCFNNGRDFLEYLDNNGKIDIVIMDYLIPLVNGIDCIKKLRKMRKNVPAFLFTAYSSEQTKREAFIAGCDEYILKPIYPEKIFMLLEKYLAVEKPASKTF